MIHDILVTNTQTKEWVSIKSDPGDYVLDIDSTDWDSPKVDFNSYKIPFQFGVTLTTPEIGSREPQIVGHVVSEVKPSEYESWADYYEARNSKIEELKFKLSKIFNPLSDVTVEITGTEYMLVGRPSPVKFGTNYEENNEIVCVFTVDLNCYNPMFQRKSSKVVTMSTVTPAFRFPWILKPNKVLMGYVGAQKAITVNNEGDCDVGGIIVFKALTGTVKNPKFYNIETNEFIEIEVTLEQNDYITINTIKGQEDVVVHRASSGTDESYLGNVKDGSSFLQFRQGTYLYGYSVTEGTEVFVDATISIIDALYNLGVS